MFFVRNSVLSCVQCDLSYVLYNMTVCIIMLWTFKLKSNRFHYVTKYIHNYMHDNHVANGLASTTHTHTHTHTLFQKSNNDTFFCMLQIICITYINYLSHICIHLVWYAALKYACIVAHYVR